MAQINNSDIKVHSCAFGTLQAAMKGNLYDMLKKLLDWCVLHDKTVYIDSAQQYGSSESDIGNFLHDFPQALKYFLLVTKGGVNFDANDPYHSLDQLQNDMDQSLNKLGVNKVHCYMIHRINPKIDLNDLVQTMKAIHGGCEYFGVSALAFDKLHQLVKLCKNNGVKLRYLESAFSLFSRSLEQLGVLRFCYNNNIKVLSYTSVLRGLLKQNMLNLHFNLPLAQFKDQVFKLAVIDNDFEKSVGYYDDDKIKVNMRAVINFLTLTQAKNISPQDYCIAYVISKGCIPIVGTGDSTHLVSNLNAANIKLNSSEIEKAEDYTKLFTGDPNPKLLSYLD